MGRMCLYLIIWMFIYATYARPTYVLVTFNDRPATKGVHHMLFITKQVALDWIIDNDKQLINVI